MPVWARKARGVLLRIPLRRTHCRFQSKKQPRVSYHKLYAATNRNVSENACHIRAKRCEPPQCNSVIPNGPLLALCGLSADTVVPAHIWLGHAPLIFDTATVPSALFVV